MNIIKIALKVFLPIAFRFTLKIIPVIAFQMILAKILDKLLSKKHIFKNSDTVLLKSLLMIITKLISLIFIKYKILNINNIYLETLISLLVCLKEIISLYKLIGARNE